MSSVQIDKAVEQEHPHLALRHVAASSAGDDTARIPALEWSVVPRSALLIVSFFVTGGHDMNVVVNPDHPDAALISVGPETPAALDPRLSGR
jgi:hypothetical protein